jgi:hypothetical protein
MSVRLIKLTLEPILGCFHSSNESHRCSPYPELFSQPDKSKRAKNMLELAILSFSGLDKSKAVKLTLQPILGYFHGLDESQRMLALSCVVFTIG